MSGYRKDLCWWGAARGTPQPPPGARDMISIRSKIAESTILFNKRARKSVGKLQLFDKQYLGMLRMSYRKSLIIMLTTRLDYNDQKAKYPTSMS